VTAGRYNCLGVVKLKFLCNRCYVFVFHRLSSFRNNSSGTIWYL
jgi:hypothetical protein